jgi:mannose-6-phosphate isomerase class I
MADYSHGRPLFIQAEESQQSAPWQEFPVSAEEFDISCIEGTTAAVDCSTEDRVELLFCIKGSGSISVPGEAFAFSAGDCFLMPAILSTYRINLDEGSLFRVRVGI